MSIYVEITKFSEKQRYWSTRAKWEQNIFHEKYSIFTLFDFRQHQKRFSQASSKALNMTAYASYLP